MHADKKYTLSFGAVNNPLQQNYLVKMLAYSRQTCVNATEKNIIVHANPVVTLLPATNLTLCQSDIPLQIAEDKNGFAGTGVFSGKGNSSTGIFDLKASGVGTFDIGYLFVSATTRMYLCSDRKNHR